MSWRLAAVRVLTTADPAFKTEAALSAINDADSDANDSAAVEARPPAKPARPDRPHVAPPTSVPRRRLGTAEGRVALLHALAHIEFNAVDLAFDMALRFADEIHGAAEEKKQFVRDWFRIGAEEARHFRMLDSRLNELGSAYGVLPAHGALWEAAEATADCVLARLAIAPMVLEARGLDVTPDLARRLRLAGDEASADILDQIYSDEIGHVAAGVRWFQRLCAERGLEPADQFRRLVSERFRGRLSPPFNRTARDLAGMPNDLYEEWNEVCGARA